MPRLAAATIILLASLMPAHAEAHMLCRWLAICPYMSPGFTLTVVDAESGKPVADVYAWAEWVQHANHGLNGPLVIQEATSDGAGRLIFPWWGPRFGYRSGLDIGADPAVIFFKPGYVTLTVGNGERSGLHVTASTVPSHGTARPYESKPSGALRHSGPKSSVSSSIHLSHQVSRIANEIAFGSPISGA